MENLKTDMAYHWNYMTELLFHYRKKNVKLEQFAKASYPIDVKLPQIAIDDKL